MVKKSNSKVLVNLSRLKKNIESLRSFLDEETRIMAVVKADAYGHGAVRIAEFLEPLVEAFAVNSIYEGIQLRDQGIANPILVFEVPQKEMASQYRVHNLTATVGSRKHFDWLPNGTSYHLNFDTGMGRMGFRPDEAKRVSRMVDDNNELFCTGLYSHFATADNPGSELVDKQLDRFNTIRKYFPEELSAHISNTGATAFYDLDQFNMVRLGIGIYGYPPAETDIEEVEPILRWKTWLAQIKRIPANSTVSYGATWKAPMDGYLGVIPVGYEDGLRRNLSGNLSVMINSELYEVVGTITMNYSMIFLGDNDFEPGTEVNILYPGSDAHDWAQKLNTIPYEILTGIHSRIPREYE